MSKTSAWTKTLTSALVVAAFVATAIPALPGAEASHCMRTSTGTESCPVPCGIAYYAVTAGFGDAGPLDTVTGQVKCGSSPSNSYAITGCTAKRSPFGSNPCTSELASGQGSAFCYLKVYDDFDGISVQGPFAFCYDPADPSKLIEATIEVVVGPAPPQ